MSLLVFFELSLLPSQLCPFREALLVQWQCIHPNNVGQLVYIHENLNKVKLEVYNYTMVPASVEEEQMGEPGPEVEPEVVNIEDL